MQPRSCWTPFRVQTGRHRQPDIHFWTRSTGIWSICDLGLCGLGSVVYPFGWDEAERLPTQHSRETVVRGGPSQIRWLGSWSYSTCSS
ncbi:hypothetical protein I7I48_10665 [Histoplasma ohiense]|nr:hypothetical protein I7I48_10665 [Histoplasma ohiense (nom. inval.)]